MYVIADTLRFFGTLGMEQFWEKRVVSECSVSCAFGIDAGCTRLRVRA